MTKIERLQSRGIQRSGSKKTGFRYGRTAGLSVSAEDRARIDALRIPPAWQQVAIASSPRAAVQAVGRDAAGRWQYLYHTAHAARRERQKYARLLAFVQALPQMRRTLARDLARPGFPAEKVLACSVRILSACFLRPGSARYAQANGSFGLATLRRRHVSVEGDRVRLSFPGKSGKHQDRELKDRRVARIVRDLLRHPGEVFKYQNDEGGWIDLRRRHINQYLKNVMGDHFSAKDFRTWSGTLVCACVLAQSGTDISESRTSRRRKVVAAIRETAKRLGNTPAVCRSSYIDPSVLTAFEEGRVIGASFESIGDFAVRRSSSLHRAERALVKLLKRKERRRNSV
jgi:DNA topoisomerase I